MTQINLYIALSPGEDYQMFAMPETPSVPRKGERVVVNRDARLVEEVSYEFTGSPLGMAHINVYLADPDA